MEQILECDRAHDVTNHLLHLIVGFITSLQAFVQILVMTNGGPANATLVYGLYIYRNAFQFFRMGYASRFRGCCS